MDFKPDTIIMILALIPAIVAHEVAHGYVAYLYGDMTAKMAGRITLNPIKHIDPVGLAVPIMLILSGASIVMGWAKPVPVNFHHLQNNKKALFFVSAAGIIVNLILIIISGVFLKLFLLIGAGSETIVYSWLVLFFVYSISINLGLALFNAIPIPPLDGSKMIEAFANEQVRYYLAKVEKYGFAVLIALLYFGIIRKVLGPIYSFLIEFIFSVLGM